MVDIASLPETDALPSIYPTMANPLLPIPTGRVRPVPHRCDSPCAMGQQYLAPVNESTRRSGASAARRKQLARPLLLRMDGAIFCRDGSRGHTTSYLPRNASFAEPATLSDKGRSATQHFTVLLHRQLIGKATCREQKLVDGSHPSPRITLGTRRYGAKADLDGRYAAAGGETGTYRGALASDAAP